MKTDVPKPKGKTSPLVALSIKARHAAYKELFAKHPELQIEWRSIWERKKTELLQARETTHSDIVQTDQPPSL